jgi:2'-5' RNA ligase
MPNLDLPEGVNKEDLECVMLDVPPIDVHALFGPDLKEKHFYYGKKKTQDKYAQGPVAEKNAHLTLLFGIHPSDNYVDQVMDALDGWEPEDLLIRKASYFENVAVADPEVKCIVLEVVPTPNLLNARRRLEQLNFTSQHTQFRPHITLAYIKGKANVDRWLARMNVHFERSVMTPTKLNLGLDD